MKLVNPFFTLLIATGCYAAWILLILYGNLIPVWLLFFLGGFVVCLHGSLQHEAVHGRPTSKPWLNTLLVTPPLSLGYPYTIYREEHTRHHEVEVLTDAENDPESLYFTPDQWSKKSVLFQYIHIINFTLLGRMTIGPFVSIVTLWRNQTRKILNGDVNRAVTWVIHILLCGAVLLMAYQVGEMPVWKYIMCFAYPGIALTLLRSYTEHRWSDIDTERSIVVEGSWVTQLLYLNNNFHWVHHEKPQLPWYEISREFKRRREEVLRNNGEFYVRGYWQMLPRLWLDKFKVPVHPSLS